MPVLSPSDLVSAGSLGERLAGAPPGGTEPALVGGRVALVEGGTVLLADAFCRLAVLLDPSEASRLSPGDLAVVALEPRLPGTLGPLVGRLTERHPPASPRALGAGSESARFARTGAFLRKRARVLAAVRAYFEAEGFLEVDTPAMVPSPGLDLHLAAFGLRGPGGREAFLSTSPEYQMKRLLAGGVPRCFQLARCFRDGEIGERHNPEFLMLEWYRAFAGYEAMLVDTERVVRAALVAAGAGDRVVVGGRETRVSASFERLRVTEAFERFAGLSPEATLALAEDDEEAFFRILIERVEPGLAALGAPVFLTHYPASQASLARRSPEDPRLAERFELYVGGVELSNGFGELTDPMEQRERFLRDQRGRAASGLPVYPIDERFLEALEEGMPPSAGNALGLDRLVMLAAGADAIADVLAFPAGWL